MEVRLAVTEMCVLGGAMIVLSLMAAGVLLSGMQIDPAEQGGTQYLDFVLFFNGALCLLPLAVALIVLAVKLMRGEYWAWVATIAICAVVVAVVPLVVWLLPAPAPFALGPVGCAAILAALLTTPTARAFCSVREFSA